MPISLSGQYNEVDSGSYLSVALSVTNTEVEAKVGGSRLSGRQTVILYNDSTATVYMGPTGVTSSGSTKGIPLLPREFRTMIVGDTVGLFLIAATAGPFSIIVQELS